jgi:hypothetical protein
MSTVANAPTSDSAPSMPIEICRSLSLSPSRLYATSAQRQRHAHMRHTHTHTHTHLAKNGASIDAALPIIVAVPIADARIELGYNSLESTQTQSCIRYLFVRRMQFILTHTHDSIRSFSSTTGNKCDNQCPLQSWMLASNDHHQSRNWKLLDARYQQCQQCQST